MGEQFYTFRKSFRLFPFYILEYQFCFLFIFLFFKDYILWNWHFFYLWKKKCFLRLQLILTLKIWDNGLRALLVTMIVLWCVEHIFTSFSKTSMVFDDNINLDFLVSLDYLFCMIKSSPLYISIFSLHFLKHPWYWWKVFS